MRPGIRPGAGIGRRIAAGVGVLLLHAALLWCWAAPLNPSAQPRLAAHDRLVIRIPLAPPALQQAQQRPWRRSAQDTISRAQHVRSADSAALPAANPIDTGVRDNLKLPPPQDQEATPAIAPPIASPNAEIPDTFAEYLYNPPPAYPSVSRDRGEQGRVMVSALVSVDGLVKDAFVEVSSGFSRLDEAAVAAVRAWRFVPATRAGVVVEMRHQIPVRFELDLGPN